MNEKNPVSPALSKGILGEFAQVPLHTYKVFFICLIGLGFANLDHSLFAYVLTEIAETFEWTIVERGWYIALTFVVAGLIITQLGVLADLVGRKKILLGSIVLAPFFVAALAWVPNTLMLLVVRTLGFATAGVQSPITGTIVLEESPARLRGMFAGILQIGYPLGFFMAALLVPPIYETFGWRYIFLLGLLGLPYAWVVWRYLREPAVWLAARAARKTLGSVPSTRELFKPAYRRKTLTLFLGEFLHVFAYGATILLTAYFREALGWSAREAIQVVGFSYGIGALGYVVAATVGEFVTSRRNTIVIWAWLGAAAFASLIWVAQSWWAIMVSFSCMTFFFYGATAVIFTFIAENFPAEIRATAVSFSGSLAVNLGIAFGPLALSYMVAATNWQWAFTVAGIIPLLLAGAVFLGIKPVPRETL